MKNNILQDLKDYFKNTPREQIEKDWAETEKYDKVGPTVSEFLEVTKSVNEFSANPKFYFNPLVDKHPVPVKIIQEVKRKDYHKIEINRDFNGRAGFWVNPSELKDSRYLRKPAKT